ncbi:MAG: 4a-hydroxytetrahydrobiopterin dehydratase [Clostridiales bacterium]|nr:4a-hydroxytetrahydrobiopterin dehydratase [Clostridiales bacterium]
MSESLKQEFCEPCSLGTPPLEGDELEALYKEVDSEWELIEEKKITHKYKFKNFKEALEFVNKVGEIAENEGHHPDIELGWGRVTISLMTHKIGGLSRNDFIMASKIDDLK